MNLPARTGADGRFATHLTHLRRPTRTRPRAAAERQAVMSQWMQAFETVKAELNLESARDIAQLRTHYQKLRTDFDPVYVQVQASRDETQKQYDEHWAALGLREKYLGGWFG